VLCRGHELGVSGFARLIDDIEMSTPQAGIDAIGGHELVVPAAFDQSSAIEHQDLVGVDHRLQPVGNQQDRPSPSLSDQGCQHLTFGLSIQLGGRLVEHQEARVPEPGAADGDSLTLTPAESLSELTYGRRQAVLQRAGPFAKCRLVESLPQLFVCGVGPGETEIVGDGAGMSPPAGG